MKTEKSTILTVSQLTNAIKYQLETTFRVVNLQGEISNFKKQSSGHMYFSIKDKHSQISAVMFRGDTSSLQKIPKDGDQVIVRGEINVYPPSGKYQIVVKELRLAGLGELLLKLEELKKKIHHKGWFRAEHKKAIPKFPKTIGVVTSPTGAAIQDILNVLTRRFYGFHLILNPVRVQGEEAASEITQAVRQFNEMKNVDVIIVGRGGGSIEDLWPFNEEIVAEAIFYSEIPIIAAVGHETDHCIAEYIADVRAPTPSAAAEMVIAEKSQQIEKLNKAKSQINQTLLHILKQYHHRLEGILKQPVLYSPYHLLGPWMQRLDDLRHTIDEKIKHNLQHKKMELKSQQQLHQTLNPSTNIIHMRQKLFQWKTSLDHAMQNRMTSLKKQLTPFQKFQQIDRTLKLLISQKKEGLKQTSNALKSIDPKNLLAKGYSIVFSEKDHSVINSIRTVQKNQEIRVLLSDGQLLSNIKEVVKNEK